MDKNGSFLELIYERMSLGSVIGLVAMVAGTSMKLKFQFKAILLGFNKVAIQGWLAASGGCRLFL